MVDARIQRLKRAMDLSLKHQYLPEHLQVRAPSFPLDLDLSIRIMAVVVVTVASEVALLKTTPDVTHYRCNVANDCMSSEMCPLMCLGLGCTFDSYGSTCLKFQRRPTILNRGGHFN